MAAGTTPIFVATPKMWHGIAVTANTNRDGTGTIATVVTGGSNGSRIDWLRITGIATSTVGNVRLFITDSSAGTTRLFRDVEVPAVTVASGTAPWAVEIDYTQTPILLESGDVLGVATDDGEDYVVHAFGGDY